MAGKTLDPHLWTLENLFESMYDVPVYQRPYSWDREQVDVLLSDIIEAYESDSRNEGYYTGNIIVYDKNDKISGLITKYEIIDGQQRITTFTLILMALYTMSLTIGVSETDKTLSNIKEALWKYFNRAYHKEYTTVTLNSIEKKCFSDLYNQCFDNPKTVIRANLKINNSQHKGTRRRNHQGKPGQKRNGLQHPAHVENEPGVFSKQLSP